MLVREAQKLKKRLDKLDPEPQSMSQVNLWKYNHIIKLIGFLILIFTFNCCSGVIASGLTSPFVCFNI